MKQKPIKIFCIKSHFPALKEFSPRGVVANILDYDIVVNKFELQRYYVHFLTITLGKNMDSLIPSTGKIVPLLFFYEDGFGV